MTSKIHTHKGWTITRGTRRRGHSDRADRWYIDDGTTTVLSCGHTTWAMTSASVDRRGPGYANLAEARRAVDHDLLLRGAW